MKTATRGARSRQRRRETALQLVKGYLALPRQPEHRKEQWQVERDRLEAKLGTPHVG